jgi:hypothetical protein
MSRLGWLLTTGVPVAAAALVACSSGPGSTAQPAAATTTASTASTSTGVGGASGSGGATGAAGEGGAGQGGRTGHGGAGGHGFASAPHAAAPEDVDLGGSVLKAPRVQPIRYASDPHGADVDGFLAELASTPYWGQVTSEYGVGPLTILPSTVLPDAPPAAMTDQDLVDVLAKNLGGASPAWGAPDSSTIYLFEIPEGTSLDASGKCCADFDGYHQQADVGGGTVTYGVVCACPGLDGPNVDDVQQITVAVSHELVEAATDPLPQTDPAYAQTDDDHAIWTVVTGGELADLCEYDDDAFVVPQGSKYMVQRSWSDKAAKAGRRPCLPADGGPYFNSVPVLPDQVTLDYYDQPWPTRGVKMAVGETRTIDVQLFSEADTGGPWTVQVYDYESQYNGGQPNLELSLDKSEGKNGDVMKLTIKVIQVDPQTKGAAFVMTSTLGDRSSLWIGVVGS